MKRFSLFVLSLAVCGAAMARPTYDFKEGWDEPTENNDQVHPVTHQAYTQQQIRTFLEEKKDPNAIELGSQILAACGFVEIQKGCHQATDRHVTIRADGRIKSNQVKACELINTSSGIHVDGC